MPDELAVFVAELRRWGMWTRAHDAILREVRMPAECDPVNHPRHYTSHPSGVECIQVTEHMSFNLGNAVKYLWRADLKGDALEDLRKAAWYVNREIKRREHGPTT